MESVPSDPVVDFDFIPVNNKRGILSLRNTIGWWERNEQYFITYIKKIVSAGLKSVHIRLETNVSATETIVRIKEFFDSLNVEVELHGDEPISELKNKVARYI